MGLRKVEPALRELAARIESEQRFLLVTHVQPDGDGIGSLLGMELLLKALGKATFSTWGEPIDLPPQYAWLPGADAIAEPAGAPDWPNLIALDCASLDRLGVLSGLVEKIEFSASLDHHSNGGAFAGLNVVAPEAAATCELVYRLAQVMNVPVSRDMALCLYVGILTDTGRFQYSNTSGRVLRVAAELLDVGLNAVDIFRHVYEGLSFGTTVLLGRMLAGARFEAESGLVWSLVTQRDVSEATARASETENFVDFLRAVEGARVAALVREAPDGRYKVSLRSPGIVDVGALAVSFGGGGHRNAAGCTLTGSFDETITALREAVRRFSTGSDEDHISAG